MTQETNGGFVGGAPECSLAQVEGIEETKYRVAFLRQNLKISLLRKEIC
jgi:hypothetical protein